MAKRIGITGGIGSGKSFVSRVLTNRCGVPVYDSDSRAKKLMVEDSALRESLVKLIGTQAYEADGSLNRQAVAAYLFADSRHAANVNALVHPVVCRDFENWASAQQTVLVAVESAILLESGLGDLVDGILLVEADESIRLERAMQRDHADAAKIRARMAQQCVEAARNRASWIVQNNREDTEESIYKQIKELGIC